MRQSVETVEKAWAPLELLRANEAGFSNFCGEKTLSYQYSHLKNNRIMLIQFNTDNNISGNERLQAYVETLLNDSLSRFSSHLSRVEVHLNDENSHKEGQKDKRCMLEARIEGLQPVAVTHHDETIEQAINGALNKLKSALDTVIGKMKEH